MPTQLSDLLRQGALRAVYHGGPTGPPSRSSRGRIENLVEDSTRVMQRLKALFRARGIKTPGTARLSSGSAPDVARTSWRSRACGSGPRRCTGELEVLQQLRPEGEGGDARRGAAGSGVGRAPHHSVSRAGAGRAPAGDAADAVAVSHEAPPVGLCRPGGGHADECRVRVGRPARRTSAPAVVQTRGLNRNHNRVLKNVFKGAATAAAVRSGPLQEWYQGLLTRGMREELARVTLARKLAAITLRLWKRGERYDRTQLTVQAPYAAIPDVVRWGVRPSLGSRIRDVGAGGSLNPDVRPARQSRRGTRLTIGPPAEPE